MLLVCWLSGLQVRTYGTVDRWQEVPLIAPANFTVEMAATPLPGSQLNSQVMLQSGDDSIAGANGLRSLEIGNRSGDLGDGVPDGQGSGTRFGDISGDELRV